MKRPALLRWLGPCDPPFCTTRVAGLAVLTRAVEGAATRDDLYDLLERISQHEQHEAITETMTAA